MAYSVDGKTHTDHPLMDEIVYCCKTIIADIVVKNDTLANLYETAETVENAATFVEIKDGNAHFESFPFTAPMLKSYTINGVRVYTDNQVNAILNDRDNMPVALRESTLEYCINYFLSNYEEKNNYYRSLAGLPPYPGTVYNIKRQRSDSEYRIYVYHDDFPSDYDISSINFNTYDPANPNRETAKPWVYIHELPKEAISVLQQSGFIDSLIQEYTGFNYSYIRCLGTRSIDVYTARRAAKWEILYMPRVEEIVNNRFVDIYNINRVMYLTRTYQEAYYKIYGSYYDESCILLLICQTFTDLIAEVPEWYIRRDIFDIRSVQYFLESNGIQFFDEIPLKYQIMIVRNMNKLIKFKSSSKNNNDILEIFGLEGTYIYKYYLYKSRKNDSSDTDPDNYNLEFIKFKEGDTIDNYLNDSIYKFPYNDLTLNDKYWDGVYNEWGSGTSFERDLHNRIEDAHKEKEFTLEGTKYMSVDYEVSSKKYQYQSQYFLNYILDSNIEDDVGIIIPSIDPNIELDIGDLFLLLQILTFYYDNTSDKIRRPEDTNKHIDPHHEKIYKYFEQVFTDDGDYYNSESYQFNWEEANKIIAQVKEFDTKQFDYGNENYVTYNPNDDGRFNYNGEFPPPEYDDIFGNNEIIEGPDEGYDFNDPYFDERGTIEKSDDYVYNFEDENNTELVPDLDIPIPGLIHDDWMLYYWTHVDEYPVDGPDGMGNEIRRERIPRTEDWGYDFDIDDYYDFHGNDGSDYRNYPKHWEVKTYIENRDPIATIEGFNSFPVYLDVKDWAERNIPEALITRYDKVFGFNSTLNAFSIRNFLDNIEERNPKYQFRHGYLGYSFETVTNDNGDILYYEIIYEYDDSDIYTFDEFLEYLYKPESIPTDPEEQYEIYKENTKREYMRVNPRGPLGIGGLRIVKRIDSVDQITTNFDINTECYNDVVNRLIQSDNRDEAIVLRYVFETFFIKPFDYRNYQTSDGDNVDYLSDVLRDRNYILYNYFVTITSDANPEAIRDTIRSVMNDIITTLEFYLTGDNLEYIYSSFSIGSFNSLLKYIHLLIGFFKSYKVYFLDPAVTYIIDNKLENGLNLGSGVDQIRQRKLNYFKDDKFFQNDALFINSLKSEDDSHAERYKEIVDIYGHFEPDPLDDMDYDGYYPEEQQDYEDLNGGVPDDKQNVPYKMINGGMSYEKYTDVYDLNGDGPEEHINYKTLDGGIPYDPNELELASGTNYNSRFTFIVDGGEAGTNDFFSKSIRTRVIDRQISQEVLLSDQEGNVIKSTSDGLYIKQNWASWADFDLLIGDAETAFDYLDYIINVLYNDLVDLVDLDHIQNKINQAIDEDLANIRKVKAYVPSIDERINIFEQSLYPRLEEVEEELDEFSPYQIGDI